MARLYTKIGFANTEETEPGVWTESIIERTYKGDVKKIAKRYRKGEGVNDNITINNEFSLVADPFATENLGNMRYIIWNKNKWKISSVVFERPRVLINIGGVYNG